MPAVPGLRSPYDQVASLAYVGRMFDKIRLHHRGELPQDYHAALGSGLDYRACNFLGVGYPELSAQVLTGADDVSVLEWCFDHGIRRDEHDRKVWNAFLAKLGWKDHRSEFLAERVAEQGYEGRGVQTFFDLIEIDEGRPLRSRHV